MARAARVAAGAALALLLAGCHSDSDPGPGGVTRGDARALDEAAASLDSRVASPPAPPARR